MATLNRFAGIASAAGDPVRAAMLLALLDGRALTAGELVTVAGVTPSTVSGHLARLADAGLVTVVRQGRHRYHRLASADIARMLEAVLQVAAVEQVRPAVGPRDAALRQARTCYDHLAGRLGVALADSLVAAGHVVLDGDGGFVTTGGERFFAALGLKDVVDVAPRARSKRVHCRPCLDWSERRPHLAGAVGRALCTKLLDEGWVARRPGTRAVQVTRKGELQLVRHFGIRIDQPG